MNRVLFIRPIVFLSLFFSFFTGLYAQPYIPTFSGILVSCSGLLTHTGSDTNSHFFFSGDYAGSLSFENQQIEASGKQSIFFGKTDSSGELIYLHSFGSHGYSELQSRIIFPDGTAGLLVYFRDTLNAGDSVYYAPRSGGLAWLQLGKSGKITRSRYLIRNFSGRIQAAIRDSSGTIWIGGRFRKMKTEKNFYKAQGKSDGILIRLEQDGEMNMFVLTGKGSEEIRNIFILRGKDLLLAGTFDHTLSTGDTLLNTQGREAAFLATFNADNDKIQPAIIAKSRNIHLSSGLLTHDGMSLYLSGWFRGTISSADTSVTSNGCSDGFVLNINKAGKTKIFTFGGTADDRISALATDTNDRLFMTGTFKKQLITENDTLITADRFSDIFFACFDTTGDILWTKHLGGTKEENAGLLTVTYDNALWLSGHFYQDLLFEETSQKTETGAGNFMIKFIDPCTSLHYDLPEEHTICPGTADTLDAGSGFSSYLWMPGNRHARKIQVHDTGYYYISITDRYGCVAKDSIQVIVDSVNLAFVVQDEILPGGHNGAVDLSVLSGKPPYHFIWSNGEISEDIEQLQTGTYHVMVTDSLGCFIESLVTVGLQDKTGIYDLTMYPNPFDDLTRIVYSLPEGTRVEISVYDISGRKLFVLKDQKTDKGIHSFEWARENLKNGIYYLRMRSRFGILSKKVMILNDQ